jgi:hypothetical protein
MLPYLVLPCNWVTELSPGYSSADKFVPLLRSVTGLLHWLWQTGQSGRTLSSPIPEGAILIPDRSVSSSPLYPRGNPLTHSMPFTDRDGELWLAYIEGLPPAQPRWFWREAAMPGRRLRFDASKDSRVSSEVPAGTPFLSEARLQALLDGASPVPAPVSRWAAQAGDLARTRQANRSERWDRGAGRLRYRLRRTILAVEARLIHFEEMVSGRGGARR